ncbi:Bcr/CflA family multidrug efflux MFS transporter [Vibrio sp. DW001]|uniref:purine nucleoside transporter PunC n=1 Tax=Vibrio sp. DW001 TaxID=2912315 RepID=UPI0023B06F36|nr:purine nucleoside transporter PunC [Vibrio sp. DW001]WED29726.1 Bcr/CflA family multidrug efflux MFS transporter [Vibrio sp. DW001]
MSVSKLQIFYLSALSMLGFIATDMYLPAFDSMQTFFATGPQQVALSLTVFLTGMGIGQLGWGVLSEKYGYRKSLVAGLFIFSAASFGLLYSTQVWHLLTLRFIQAIGVCAPAVIWQAMVISRYPEKVSQQLFATIMPLVALSPALAPQLGVLLLGIFDWQSIFLSLTAFGLILMAVTLRQPQSEILIKKTSTLEDIKLLVKSKEYMGNITIFAFASAAFFAYLTGMPVIMSQMGYTPHDIGMSFLPQTAAFIIGGYLGKKWTQKLGTERVLKSLLIFFSVSVVLLFVSSQWTLTSIWPILIPFCLIAMVNGALYPIVVNKALVNAKHSPATAAGFQNSFQIAVSSVSSGVVATFALNAQSVTGLVILFCTVGLWVGYIVSNRKLAAQFTIPDNARVGPGKESHW